MSALGDGFRKHPIALSIIGMFTIASVAGSIADAVDGHDLPEAMDCIANEMPTGSSITIRIGASDETQLNVKDANGQNVTFTCTPR